MAFVVLILFLAIPTLEIALFIEVGSALGVFPTLAITFATAAMGIFLVRRQGFHAFSQIRQAQARGEAPVRPVLHGVVILAAGLLLLTPGFFTDAVGFALLVPPIRSVIIDKIAARAFGNAQFRYQSSGGRVGPIVDGEAEEIPQAKLSGAPPTDQSPWRKPEP